MSIRTVRFDCWKKVGICRSSHQPDECDARPFFRWVRVQGCSPDMAGSSKNSLGLVSISLIIIINNNNNKPSPTKEGSSQGGRPPEAWERWSWHARHECWPTRIHIRRPRPNATRTRIHLTRSVYQPTWLTKVCSSFC